MFETQHIWDRVGRLSFWAYRAITNNHPSETAVAVEYGRLETLRYLLRRTSAFRLWLMRSALSDLVDDVERRLQYLKVEEPTC